MTLYTILLIAVLFPVVAWIMKRPDDAKPEKGSRLFCLMVFCVSLFFIAVAIWIGSGPDSSGGMPGLAAGVEMFMMIAAIMGGILVIGLLFLFRWALRRFRQRRINPDKPESESWN